MSGDPLLVLDGLVQVFPQVSATACRDRRRLDWFNCGRVFVIICLFMGLIKTADESDG
jgi:hypothetical protein